MDPREIVVTVKDKEVICTPPEVDVRGGDTVQWTSSNQILVQFVNANPFDETGPFTAGQIATVSRSAEEGTYTPDITVVSEGITAKKAIGDVKVGRP